MRRLLLAVLIGTTTAGVAATSSCAMPAADCSSDGTCATAADVDASARNQTSDSGSSGSSGSTSDATVEAATPPPNCDVTADSKTTAAAACVDNGFAVFVDANAVTAGDGTKEKPLQTITAALGVAVPKGKQRIYVCGTSTFAEHVSVTAQNAVRLIGGFDCTNWLPLATGMIPKVAPSDAGYALQVNTVTSDFAVEDMSFEAVAGTTAAPSSIAVFVASSPNVTFTRVAISANDAGAVNDGANGIAPLSSQDPKGTNAAANLGGTAKTCTCNTGGSSQGGKGGDTSGAQVDGANGLQPISPSVPPLATGAGQSHLDCNDFGPSARPGSSGPNGSSPTNTIVGVLSGTGWKGGDGNPGTNGQPGQGGGGGGSRTDGDATTNGGGGGGGCGGCGGGGGGGGGSGGSSIGILAFDSPLKLVSGSVTSGQATNGGGGQAGISGGGASVGGTQANQGCPGQGGGAGGSGGAGAGGAGGVSAAIFYSGSAPAPDPATSMTHGSKGQGGLGGVPGTNDGPLGLEGTLVPLP